ncbi:hypothetical protein M3I53_16255 [Paraburkholderia sp. CNPSo 3272]|uniref:hypothetical protein n=1 Tax=Paraburkholderia sp. CNPSo 3272 TaxID=2940931 RepID=UPI0020B8E49C|nr:hypothetical protein [Paraburkholderia sp. CNPSo 3272]MCP3724659.1 hypothetical protein [Paraburkholderia sp. CNPSo 3272]
MSSNWSKWVDPEELYEIGANIPSENYPARKGTGNFLKELVALRGLEWVRETMIFYHADMVRGARTRPHVYVSFYKWMLDEEIWSSLDALARAVKIPAARLRKALFLAEFPEEIADLFFHEKLTPQLAKALSALTSTVAKDDLIFRASMIPEYADVSKKLPALKDENEAWNLRLGFSEDYAPWDEEHSNNSGVDLRG